MVAVQTQAQMDNAHWQYTATPEMDETQFRQWVCLLEARTGIALPLSRKTFLITNLHTRMRELKISDYQSYFALVTDGARGQIEWETLVDRLTVHETRFYRDMHALELIRERYLQPLLSESHETPYTLHAWSVGCATGEEPYTLAMLLDSMLAGHGSVYYGIIASDVSRAAINTGRQAVYHVRRVKNVPQDIARKYLKPVDEEHVQVVEALRNKVCFTAINLLDLDSQPLGGLDIILCQNVLIYFKHEMRNRILDGLVARLKPGGMLVLGAGEVFGWTHPQLQTIKYESTLAYQRMVTAEGVQ